MSIRSALAALFVVGASVGLCGQTTQTVTTPSGEVITVTVTVTVTPPAPPVVVPPPVVIEPPPVVVEPPPVVIEPPPVVVPPVDPPPVEPPVVVAPPVVDPPPVVVPPVEPPVEPPPVDVPPAPPDPATFKLVQKDTLVWIGAICVPSGKESFYSQGALAYNAERNSLFIGGLSGEKQPQWAIEMSIPEITATGKNCGTVLQPAADVFDGKRFGDLMGGLFVFGGRLIATNYVYYGANMCGYEHYSHVAGGLDLSVKDDAVGPVRIETTNLTHVDPTTSAVVNGCTGLRAGFVAGYMADIPKPWQAALGGPAFTGACCYSIIERTSWGPTVSVFNPDDIGKGPVNATMVLGYPQSHASAEGLGPLAYDKTTGAEGASWSSEYFNLTTVIRGVVFPEGTRSVLFFGKHGPGRFCYGDKSLTTPAGQMKPFVAGSPNIELNGYLSCFQVTSASQVGGHTVFSTTPDRLREVYRQQVWAYDALDLAAVKAGTKLPWQVLPYAIWTPATPLGDQTQPTGSQTSGLQGAAYDKRTGNIFVYQPDGGGHPIIDVYRVQ